MPTQFSRWSRNIGLNILSAAFILLCVSGEDVFADATQDGKDIGNAIVDKFDSKSDIKNRAILPLTTDQQMPTIGGGQIFDAQISCPSTKKFLDVFVTPQATGDISIIVGQDIDMDGTTEYSFTLPFIVSGICANGIITCDPGTWYNCSHYEWFTSLPSKQVDLNLVAPIDVGGCYCINNDCGTDLAMRNIDLVLKNLGGGIAASIVAVDPNFAIADAQINGTLITYYGQATADCTGTGHIGQEQYYNNPSQMDADTNNYVITETADPDSLHNKLKTFSRDYALKQCTIRNVVTIDNVTDNRPATGSRSGNYTLCTEHYVYMRVLKQGSGTGNLQYHYQILDTGTTNNKHKGCGGAGSGGGVGDWHTIRTLSYNEVFPPGSIITENDAVNFCLTATGGFARTGLRCSDVPSIPSGCYEIYDRIFFGTCYVSCPVCVTGVTENVSSLGTRHQVIHNMSDEGNIIFNYSLSANSTITGQYDTVNESVDDGCATLSTDPDCSLKTEEVDGVTTIRNFNPTGLIPDPSCRTFSGMIQTFEICKDWWQKDRTYSCIDNNPYDFSDIKQSIGSVTSSATRTGSTMTYTYEGKDETGTWYSYSGVDDLGTIHTYSACEEACKTRIPADHTGASPAGHRGQFVTSTQGWDFYYKVCASGTCPTVGPPEEIVTSCQCISEFAEAATIMLILDETTKDIICSTMVEQ